MLKYLQRQELNESNEQAAEKKTPAMDFRKEKTRGRREEKPRSTKRKEAELRVRRAPANQLHGLGRPTTARRASPDWVPSGVAARRKAVPREAVPGSGRLRTAGRMA